MKFEYFSLIKSKLDEKLFNIDNQYVLCNEDYIEWKISDWQKLNENKSLKCPNFRIGNGIWYV